MHCLTIVCKVKWRQLVLLANTQQRIFDDFGNKLIFNLIFHKIKAVNDAWNAHKARRFLTLFGMQHWPRLLLNWNGSFWYHTNKLITIPCGEREWLWSHYYFSVFRVEKGVRFSTLFIHHWVFPHTKLC